VGPAVSRLGRSVVCVPVSGLDHLAANQWRNVWPYIENFTFDLGRLHGNASGDVAWAAVPWTSTGFDQEGRAFDRPGRATVTFAHREGRWLAVHTHFSLNPGTPARSFGRGTAAEPS
jgi:ketosteroid isomerase-like protein